MSLGVRMNEDVFHEMMGVSVDNFAVNMIQNIQKGLSSQMKDFSFTYTVFPDNKVISLELFYKKSTSLGKSLYFFSLTIGSEGVEISLSDESGEECYSIKYDPSHRFSRTILLQRG